MVQAEDLAEPQQQLSVGDPQREGIFRDQLQEDYENIRGLFQQEPFDMHKVLQKDFQEHNDYIHEMFKNDLENLPHGLEGFTLEHLVSRVSI